MRNITILVSTFFIGFTLTACQTLDDKMQNQIGEADVSGKYDGKWAGDRVNLTKSSICKKTTIKLDIKNGQVSAVQTYNNSSPKGVITADGAIAFWGGHRKWQYQFTGKFENDKLIGIWEAPPAPCNGTWELTRVE